MSCGDVVFIKMSGLERIAKESFRGGMTVAAEMLAHIDAGFADVANLLRESAETGAGIFWKEKVLPAIQEARKTKNGGAVCTGPAATQGR